MPRGHLKRLSLQDLYIADNVPREVYLYTYSLNVKFLLEGNEVTSIWNQMRTYIQNATREK